MMGVDTNVLVRYLTQDDQDQSVIVNSFIEKIVEQNEKICVNLMVICELVWVLEDCYRYPKNEIIKALRALCDVHVIEIESRDILLQALLDYQHHGVDISDCLIGRFNQQTKCAFTVSFDKRACKLASFRSLKSYI